MRVETFWPLLLYSILPPLLSSIFGKPLPAYEGLWTLRVSVANLESIGKELH